MPESTADLRAITRTPVRVASPLARYRAEPARHEIDGDLYLTAMGGADPSFNFAAVVGPVAPARVFARAEAFFGDTTYSVVVESDTAQPTEDALRAAGWRLDEDEPALVLAPIPAVIPTPPPGLTIQIVTTDAGLDDFYAVSETPRRWVPSLAAARDPAVALFVGYVAGEPVATSRLVRCEDVGDITSVVTAPAHRRQGFGTALTWAACAEGARRGCSAATLTASTMGYPVYRAMGFVPVCAYRTYLPPAASRA